MKARCKPGDIAVIVGLVEDGKLVTVIRAYVEEEFVDGCAWTTEPGVTWVVEALGSTLSGADTKGKLFPHKRVAINDRNLIPIRNERGEDEMLRLTGKPKDKPVVAKKRGRPAKQKEAAPSCARSQ